MHGKLQNYEVVYYQAKKRTINFLLNLPYFRDPDKMAHSPSTSQKTFFGRGRGR